MDLLGDIVEKDTTEDNTTDAVSCNAQGFPEPFRPKQISSWKQRLSAKRDKHSRASQPAPRAPPTEAPSTAAQSIHEENLQALKQMSPEAIERERQELMESLDPRLVQKLIRNMDRRASEKQQSLFPEMEGAAGTWVGGNRENGQLPSLSDDQVDKALEVQSGARPEQKSVSFADEPAEASDRQAFSEEALPKESLQDLDADDVAPLDFQAAQSIDHMSNKDLFQDVHFMKPEESQDEKLDLDDPDFDDKLHEKFFPDLPKDVEKLKWMQPLPDTEPADTVIEDVSQCRFDFNGNLVPPTREIKSTIHSALHHHSDDPHLAGYTIPELQRLSRSTFAAQRAISVQTLGRILYKLGKQSYYQLIPEVDPETYKEEGSAQGVINKIYSMFWDLCSDCRILDCLQDAADETKTRHLSVRNYALEALWLWKQGGGDFRKKPPTS